MITFQDLMERKLAVQRRKWNATNGKTNKISDIPKEKKQRALIKFKLIDKIDTVARKND